MQTVRLAKTEKKYIIAVIASKRTVAGILWQYDTWRWHTDTDTAVIDLLIIWADSHQETDDDLLFSSLKLL